MSPSDGWFWPLADRPEWTHLFQARVERRGAGTLTIEIPGTEAPILAGVSVAPDGSILFSQVDRIASLSYVILWEAYVSATDYAFIQGYTRSILTAREAEGLNGTALQVEVDSMNELEAQHARPLFRLL